MRAVPLTVQLARRLRPQASQRHLLDPTSDEQLVTLILAGPGYAAMDGDDVVAIAGIVEHAPRRYEVWLILAETVGARRMLGLVRGLQRFLDDAAGWRRLEAWTDARCRRSAALVRRLGFEPEGVARSFCADGRDAIAWARIRRAPVTSLLEAA